MKLSEVVMTAQLNALRRAVQAIPRINEADSIKEFIGSPEGLSDNYDRFMHTFDREYDLYFTEPELKEVLPSLYKAISILNVLLDGKIGRHDMHTEKCGGLKFAISKYLVKWQVDGYRPESRIPLIKKFKQDFEKAVEKVSSLPNHDFWVGVNSKIDESQTPLRTPSGYTKAICELVIDYLPTALL